MNALLPSPKAVRKIRNLNKLKPKSGRSVAQGWKEWKWEITQFAKSKKSRLNYSTRFGAQTQDTTLTKSNWRWLQTTAPATKEPSRLMTKNCQTRGLKNSTEIYLIRDTTKSQLKNWLSHSWRWWWKKTIKDLHNSNLKSCVKETNRHLCLTLTLISCWNRRKHRKRRN